MTNYDKIDMDNAKIMAVATMMAIKYHGHELGEAFRMHRHCISLYAVANPGLMQNSFGDALATMSTECQTAFDAALAAHGKEAQVVDSINDEVTEEETQAAYKIARQTFGVPAEFAYLLR